ncbi:MAG: M4 family metallopeptidase, partial [Chitinophagales bacterium]
MLKTTFLIVLFCIAGFTICFAQQKLSDWVWNETTESTRDVSIDEAAQTVFDAANLNADLALETGSNLRMMNTENDLLGFTHYRFRQTYLDIPVEHTMYIVHVKSGKICGMSGNLVKGFGADMQKRATDLVTISRAKELGMQSVNAMVYQTIPEPNQAAPTDPEIVWYCEGNKINPRQLRLAYKVDVYALEPLSRNWIYVDAQSGAILGKEDRLCAVDAICSAATAYSGTVTIHADLNAGIYTLHDLTRGQGIFTYSDGGGDYTSTAANWTLTGFKQYALDAHFGVAASYDFFLSKFGRNSLDNAGLAINSYLKSSLNDNAWWTGTSMSFGKASATGFGVASIDVCGHELTHGVTQYTCGLQYYQESGAISESLSDIMGKCIQFYQKPADINWVIGNDMDWTIRDLSDPNQYGQPDTYLGTYWWTSSIDNYGVHYNSGLGNFMFYLLVNGGSGTNDIGDNYHVDAIGQSKAEQIIYRSQTTYLFNLSQYSDWRVACINAATDLYGAASDEVTQVKNAWYAVGIGSPGNAQTSNTCNKPTALSSSAITSSSATVSWGNVTNALGYNIQYKPYLGTRWTTVAALPFFPTKTLSGLAWGTIYNYRVQTKCIGGFSAYSTDKVFTTSSLGEVYCKSNGNYHVAYEYIDYVNMGSINREYAYPDAGGYYNANTFSTTINKGSSYSLTVSAGFNGFMEADLYPENWAVFVDWNLDGDFSDAGETAITTTTTDAGNKIVTLPIPYTATIGATRMRVSMNYDVTPP